MPLRPIAPHCIAPTLKPMLPILYRPTIATVPPSRMTRRAKRRLAAALVILLLPSILLILYAFTHL